MKPHTIALSGGWRLSWLPRRHELLLSRNGETVAVPLGVLAEWELTIEEIRYALRCWRDLHKLPEGTHEQRAKKRRSERARDKKRKALAALGERLGEPA